MFSQLTRATNTAVIMPPWQQKKILENMKIFPQLLKCFRVKYIWCDRSLLKNCTKRHRNHSNIIQILFYYSILFLNLLFSLTKRHCVLQEWPNLECFSVQAGAGTLTQLAQTRGEHANSTPSGPKTRFNSRTLFQWFRSAIAAKIVTPPPKKKKTLQKWPQKDIKQQVRVTKG